MLHFSARMDIPRAGTYTFYLSSDDGSILSIDGQRLFDNDGFHAALEKSGAVHLGEGEHPLDLRFFQRGGGSSLHLDLEGPSMERRSIPVSWLNSGKN